MPRVDNLIDWIGGAKFITTLDPSKSYWQNSTSNYMPLIHIMFLVKLMRGNSLTVSGTIDSRTCDITDTDCNASSNVLS